MDRGRKLQYLHEGIFKKFFLFKIMLTVMPLLQLCVINLSVAKNVLNTAFELVN